MAWSAPVAFSSGDPLTLSLANQYMVDNPQYLYDYLGIASANFGYSKLTGAGSFSFSITSGFDNLYLMMTLRSSAAANSDTALIRFNGDAGTNYEWTSALAAGSGASNGTSAGGTQTVVNANTLNANEFSGLYMIIHNYNSSSIFKPYTIITSYLHQNGTLSRINTIGGSYISTTAISSITITASSGTTFIAGSEVSIFGTRHP